MKLKYREPGQGTEDERKNKDYRRELEERERASRSRSDKDKSRLSGASGETRESIQAPPPSKKSKSDPAYLDADDPQDASDGDDDDSSSDDEDDTAALMAELQRIKKERAVEQAKLEAEKRAEEERIRAENILSGNPLLNYTGPATKGDMTVKRRWDEDVVFKNCARADDSGKGKTFINDCLRSDFHRKFMEKYIK
jgi:protein CWC15